MPKLILMFNVTVAAAGHEWLSVLQLHSTSSASIDLVGSAWVHLDNSTSLILSVPCQRQL